MLKQRESFWEHEATAPLMALNDDFLTATGQPDAFFERFDKWLELAGVTASEEMYKQQVEITNKDTDEAAKAELARVVEADAIRTFFGTDNRKKLVRFLTLLRTLNKDYGQGMSYVASFLLLFLEEHKAFAIMNKLISDEKYIPGYWAAEAIKFATDALVFNELVEQRQPEVAKHLAAHFVLPGTYVQKWFTGVGVHVLPFKDLCVLFEVFLEQGYPALQQFGLSLVAELKEDLLKQKSSTDLFAVLRLEPAKVSREACSKIVTATRSAFEGEPFKDVDFPALRTKLFERELAPRLRRAAEAGVGEESESDSWDSDEEGAECALCMGMPDYYCTVRKIAICGMCHEKTESLGYKVEEFDYDNPVHMAPPKKDDEDEAKDEEKEDPIVDKLADAVANLDIASK